mgnify:CR=1 FL=1
MKHLKTKVTKAQLCSQNKFLVDTINELMDWINFNCIDAVDGRGYSLDADDLLASVEKELEAIKNEFA